jgi:hypothetical protein
MESKILDIEKTSAMSCYEHIFIIRAYPGCDMQLSIRSLIKSPREAFESFMGGELNDVTMDLWEEHRIPMLGSTTSYAHTYERMVCDFIRDDQLALLLESTPEQPLSYKDINDDNGDLEHALNCLYLITAAPTVITF